MNPNATLATAVRVLRQLRRDPRTLALLVGVPCLLLVLLKYVFIGQPQTFDRIGGPMVGLFPFVTMFVVTSITMLRERTTGTLERLMTMPLAKLDLLLGYGIAFAAVATVQAGIVSAVAFGGLGLDIEGPVWPVVLPGCRERGARHGPRPLPERFRGDGVPGRPVHARIRPTADLAVWTLRPPRADGAAARDPLLCPSSHLRLRRPRAGDERRALRGARGAGRRGHCRLDGLALALGAATLRRRTP